MRRGCISLGDTRCDVCQRIIPDAERYLANDEEGKETHYCIECALKKGYASWKKEKQEQILTFFPDY